MLLIYIKGNVTVLLELIDQKAERAHNECVLLLDA